MKKYFTILSLIAISFVSCFDIPNASKISNVNEDELLKPYIEAFMKERTERCPNIKTTDTDMFIIKQRAIFYIAGSRHVTNAPPTHLLTPKNMVKYFKGEEESRIVEMRKKMFCDLLRLHH